MPTTTKLKVKALTGAIGAEISGVDLRRELDSATVAAIRQALLDHLVVFFRDQDITTEQQLAFAACFGKVGLPGFARPTEQPSVTVFDTSSSKGYTNHWHADDSWMEIPPFGAVLRAVALPATGGDTCFANMYTAFDALSPAMQAFLEGLTAVHSNIEITAMLTENFSDLQIPRAKAVEHPVVSVHPETHRKLLYVNSSKTTKIVELDPPESQMLLAYLFDHVKSPEFQCRFHWEPHSIAMWDNRAVQHYAVADYHEARVMHRVLIEGVDRPTGPRAAEHAQASVQS